MDCEPVDCESVGCDPVDCEPVDCVLVELLVDDCELGELDVLCAATQTADSSRIAVIRYAFLIWFLLYIRPADSCGPLSSWKQR